KRIKTSLEKEVLAKDVPLTDEEREALGVQPLITLKPVIYVFNVSEKEISQVDTSKYQEFAPSVVLSAKLEAELSELALEEQKDYLHELGLEQSGLEKLIQVSFKLLGLQTFFTAGEKEVRAW